MIVEQKLNNLLIVEAPSGNKTAPSLEEISSDYTEDETDNDAPDVDEQSDYTDDEVSEEDSPEIEPTDYANDSADDEELPPDTEEAPPIEDEDEDYTDNGEEDNNQQQDNQSNNNGSNVSNAIDSPEKEARVMLYNKFINTREKINEFVEKLTQQYHKYDDAILTYCINKLNNLYNDMYEYMVYKFVNDGYISNNIVYKKIVIFIKTIFGLIKKSEKTELKNNAKK